MDIPSQDLRSALKPSKVVFTAEMEQALSVYIETGVSKVQATAPVAAPAPAGPVLVAQLAPPEASAAAPAESSSRKRSLSDLAARVRLATKK